MKSWLYLTAEGVVAPSADWPCRVWSALHQGTPMPLHQAAEALAGQSVDLLVPMELCSWVRSEPWPSRRQPGAQAVAFAVEEQLSEPLEQLHVSVGARDSDGRYPVMVIGRERMAGVLSLLAESAVELRSASVDADMLPDTQPLGVRCFGRWLLGGALPARMVLSNEGLKTLRPILPADIHWLDDHQGDAFFDQCLNVRPAHAINLLQGRFAPSQKPLPWRIGALALFTSLLLTWGGTEARIWFVEGQSRQLVQESEQQFKALYPDQPHTMDMAAQLKVLQHPPAQSQSTRTSELLKLVEHVIGASSVEVQRVELRAGEGWKIQLTANSFAELEQLRERGRQQGMPVRLDSANKADDRVHATLTFEDGA
ncbi:type II secretion system protein GspL [Pseudomonas violetae]|uniref:Type II secretion system protein L n=1 Tax=Pseudomonas violetae TaxID=2915813 RepID=A0ABT0F5J1_9PSED|nr:type II secretion system protein GspL [Pseudomonas violetae]MCK1792942.1 type II secretion system protein GspL [Pseudomonas violetae]